MGNLCNSVNGFSEQFNFIKVLGNLGNLGNSVNLLSAKSNLALV